MHPKGNGHDRDRISICRHCDHKSVQFFASGRFGTASEEGHDARPAGLPQRVVLNVRQPLVGFIPVIALK